LKSLDEAYKTIADQKKTVSKYHKATFKIKIEQELSSKEYNLLFHDIPQTEIKEVQETYGTPTVRYFVQIL